MMRPTSVAGSGSRCTVWPRCSSASQRSCGRRSRSGHSSCCGAFAFVDGITALSTAISRPPCWSTEAGSPSGASQASAPGSSPSPWPSITALALLVVIATWSLLIGGSRIAFAVEVRKQVHGAWTIGLGGALLILLGVLLIINPGAGAIGITWAIGWFAFLFGGLELWLTATVRHETHESTTPDRHPGLEPRTRSGLT